MKKRYLLAVILLSSLYFSCNDKDKSISSKMDASSLEGKVEIIESKSTKELFFIKGQKIADKTITLVVRNSDAKEVEVPAPIVTPPERWNLNIKLDKAADQELKIKLNKGENTLTYKLSGSGKAPTDAENDDKITISFEGKESNIALKLTSITIKEAKYTGEDIIVGRTYNSKGENNKIELTLSLAEGIEDSLLISLPEFINSKEIQGLSAKRAESSSITLEKGKEKKVTYLLEGTHAMDGNAIFEATIAGVGKSIQVPVRYLKADEVSLNLSSESVMKQNFEHRKNLTTETPIFIERTDIQKGEAKIKPSDVMAFVDSINGLTATIKENKEMVFKNDGKQKIVYVIQGTPVSLGDYHFTFKLKKDNLKSFKIPFKVYFNEFYLHDAISRNDIQVVKNYINAGADLNTIYNYNTPLHVAAESNCVDIARLLIRKDANLINSRNQKGEKTPLHSAAFYNKTDMMTFLILKNADKNSRDHIQETPLHIAASLGNLEAVKVLLENKAEIEVVNNIKDTPLHNAARNDRIPIVTALINSFKSRNASQKNLKNFINTQNNKGETALDIAKKNKYVYIEAFLESQLN